MSHQLTHSFEKWANIVSSSFVPLNSESHRTRTFTGRLNGRTFGDIAVNTIEADPHTVIRHADLIETECPAFYKIGFQHSGQGLLLQDGKEIAVRPGQFVLYDTSRPYTLSFEKHFTTSVLMVPRNRLELESQDFSQLTASRLGERHQLSAPIFQLMEYVGHDLNEIDDGPGNRLISTITELLQTVFDQELHPVRRHNVNNHKVRTTLMAILDYIEEHLEHSWLTPQHIADAHYLSLRSLYLLFEDNDMTVSATIRAKRLERCRRELLRPSQATTSIAAIGARWGFHDPAYFSRVFSQTYGTSPSQFRSSL